MLTWVFYACCELHTFMTSYRNLAYILKLIIVLPLLFISLIDYTYPDNDEGAIAIPRAAISYPQVYSAMPLH